jgi:hypothetical protein
MQAYAKELVAKGTNYITLELLFDSVNASGVYGLNPSTATTGGYSASTGAQVVFTATYRIIFFFRRRC